MGDQRCWARHVGGLAGRYAAATTDAGSTTLDTPSPPRCRVDRERMRRLRRLSVAGHDIYYDRDTDHDRYSDDDGHDHRLGGAN